MTLFDLFLIVVAAWHLDIADRYSHPRERALPRLSASYLFLATLVT